VTEIYLCDVRSCQEILRRNGRGQVYQAAVVRADLAFFLDFRRHGGLSATFWEQLGRHHLTQPPERRIAQQQSLAVFIARLGELGLQEEKRRLQAATDNEALAQLM
jgi:hypothetical protein